jgi:DNA polymerase-3 subunit epsilon
MLGRYVFLDTETTGMAVSQGHRVIEIGAVGFVNGLPDSSVFHSYLNVDKRVDKYAYKVHGISNKFLRDKPRFVDISTEFIEFIKDAKVVIHNSSFDLNHLNNEFRLAGLEFSVESLSAEVIDSLKLARQIFPKQKNTLDVLIQRLGIKNTSRELHSALEDAKLLSKVYMALIKITHGSEDENFKNTMSKDYLKEIKESCGNCKWSDIIK